MTDTSITITPTTPTMLSSIAKLMRVQDLQQRRQDPRLFVRSPMATVAALTTALAPKSPTAARPLVALDGQGQVRGSVEPSLWELSTHIPYSPS